MNHLNWAGIDTGQDEGLRAHHGCLRTLDEASRKQKSIPAARGLWFVPQWQFGSIILAQWSHSVPRAGMGDIDGSQ